MPKQEVGKRKAGRVIHALLLRAGFAEVDLLHLAADNLRQENRRLLLLANITLHTTQ